MVARQLQQNLHVDESNCQWSTVSKVTLQGMSADAKENLEAIPDKWQASHISCFFTGRADWPLFASVFPCLWGEVADKLSTEEELARAIAHVKSKEFLHVVQCFRRNEGIAPHPAVAYKLLEAEAKEHSKRAQGSPARTSSTPRVLRRTLKPRPSTPRSEQSRAASASPRVKKTLKPRASTPRSEQSTRAASASTSPRPVKKKMRKVSD